jgi:hypothetical protein
MEKRPVAAPSRACAAFGGRETRVFGALTSSTSRRTPPQMTTLWKATILLFGGALAACTFAASSMALGSNWGPVGTQHLLTSTSLRFDVHAAGAVVGVLCNHTSMLTDVKEVTRLTVTDAAFVGCQGTGGVANCTATLQAGGLPWVVTPPHFNDVVLDGVQLTIQFENRPGTGACVLPSPVTITGSVGGGAWSSSQHQIEYSSDTGLTTHAPGLPGPAITTLTGILRDATQTLTG